MNISEARAYQDGVDFYADDSIVRVLRAATGEVKVTREKQVRMNKRTWYRYLLALMFFFFYCLIQKFVSPINGDLATVSLLAVSWGLVFMFYHMGYKNPANERMFKYHAAQHKILNYFNRFKGVDFEYNKVMEMSAILDTCGSTFIAIVLVLATFIAVGYIIFPWVIANVIWYVGSCFMTFSLWRNGKCDFFQKMTLIEPSKEEIAVVAMGLLECTKMISEKEN